MKKLIISIPFVILFCAGTLYLYQTSEQEGLNTEESPATEMIPSSQRLVLPPQEAELANPASTYCVNLGGTLKVETQTDGGQYGMCHFNNGRSCEEWALLRGECSPTIK